MPVVFVVSRDKKKLIELPTAALAEECVAQLVEQATKNGHGPFMCACGKRAWIGPKFSYWIEEFEALDQYKIPVEDFKK